jgi:peptide/nickel transport system substrate-binding protein
MKFTINKTACLAGVCAALMASSVYADTLRMAFQVSPSTIDPFKSSASATASLNEHIYEGLVSRTNDKLLATSYGWTDDTTLVVNLRKGVKFHNGADFTSEDVVYSSCRMMYKVGGKKNMLTSAMGPVTDVVAIDDHTVAFKTVGLYPILIQKLKSLSILDSGDADLGPTLKFDNAGDCGITRYPTKAEFESGKYANGTGKYKYESFSITGDANLVRNDEYWGEPGNWERVEIRSVENSGARMAGLLAGDYDLIENPTGEDLLALEGNPAYSFSNEPSWRSIFLILDVGSDVAPGVSAADGSNPLKDIRVRKALSLSIDRAAIVDKLFSGNATVASQFAPSYQDGADSSMPDMAYDPELAKQLLIEAGYADSITIDLRMPSGKYQNGTRVGQAIAQYFTRIGITVNLVAEPWSLFRKGRSARELGVFMYGWGHPQGPAQMISYAFGTRNKPLNLGGSNYSNYSSPEFDAAMTAWAVETNEAKALEYNQAAMRVAVEDLPGIPLYYQHSTWAHTSDITVAGRPDERTFADMASKN